MITDMLIYDSPCYGDGMVSERLRLTKRIPHTLNMALPEMIEFGQGHILKKLIFIT
jgi:hypothetical protein